MRYYPVAVIVLALVSICAWSAYRNQPYTLSVKDTNTASSVFVKEIETFGGKKAYERFANAVKKLPSSETHGFAHTFGRALYEVEGLPGIYACDQRFEFGCFHEFMGKAIAEHGLSIVGALSTDCGRAIGSEGPCQHGLGHGILASLGYDGANLSKAIALCNARADSDPLLGCKGGAYMEYNIRTVRAAEGIGSVRALENNDYFGGCSSVPLDEQGGCIFWLPQWWYHAALPQRYVGSTPDENYSRIGDLCSSLHPDVRKRCFEGIGYTAANETAAIVRRACESAGEGLDRLHCLLFGARMLAAAGIDRSAICQSLTGSSLALCVAQTKEPLRSIDIPADIDLRR